jgi:hypothetical protein
MADKKALELLLKKLTDEGKLVEAGWVGLRLAVGLENAPADQLREMRLAFLGGAQHLFSSVMNVLEPGAEPTDADLQRMNKIADELDAAQKELVASYGKKTSDRPPADNPFDDIAGVQGGYQAPKGGNKPAAPTTGSGVKRPRSEERLGDAPIEADYREAMNSMAVYLDRYFNGPAADAKDRGKTGFVLMVFPLNDHAGRCNYIANARREDVVVMLKEQLARFEGQPEIKGRA